MHHDAPLIYEIGNFKITEYIAIKLKTIAKKQGKTATEFACETFASVLKD
jgi:hypothetical protein